MINIQGLTKQKYIELESMLNDKSYNKNMIVITETPQRIGKINPSKGAKIVNSMRKEKDKKGGIISVIYKVLTSRWKKVSKSKDILELKGRIYNKKIRVIVVYELCRRQRRERKKHKDQSRA